MRRLVFGLILGAAASGAFAQSSSIVRIELPPSEPPAPAIVEPPPVAEPAEEAPADEAGIAFSAETLAEMEAARGPSIAEMMTAEIEARRKTAELNATVAAEQAAQLRAGREAQEAEAARRNAEYEAELAEREAAAAEATRRHETEMANWRAKAAACQAGDKTQCAPEN